MKPSLDQNLQPLSSELTELAEERYQKFVTQARSSDWDPPMLAALPGYAHRVWACSEFVSRQCIRHPAILQELLNTQDLFNSYATSAYCEKVTDALDSAPDEPALLRVLRQLRRREMVRIAWRDLAALVDLHETMKDLSACADSIIDGTLNRLFAWQCEELGRPEYTDGRAQSLVVLAMGKLGAEELNFSSDVDLILAYPEAGQTVSHKSSISNEEFFARLGRRLIAALSTSTDEGFVFRVDMRLRPFGAAGPLVMSFDAIEDYYQAHGRDWERYAFIKARPAAGDTLAGERLLERLRPFVYRRYLDFSALESLREMKALIAQEINRKGLQNDVKLGPGGIRELEFIVQAFQMVRGGRKLELRDRRLLAVLARLEELEYLPQYAVSELRDAYHFLRNTENRLQQADDRQTHTLPEDARARAYLAAGMNYSDWEAFSRALDTHRNRVQSHFDQVVATPPEDTGGKADHNLSVLWEGSLDDDQAVDILGQAGFEDSTTAWKHIKRLRESYSVRMLGRRGQERVSRLMPLLLGAVVARSNPLITLQRVCAVLETIAKRSVYLALLLERPIALSQLIRLCAASSWIAQYIARYPLLLDELLDSRTLYAPLDHSSLEADLADRLNAVAACDTEEEMDTLRHFQQTNILRVAAADVVNAVPLMVVSDHLTAIAEVTLSQVHRIAWRDMVTRYGTPCCILGEESITPGFAIVAYGKLGGLELGYGSDLDLVFLHASAGEAQRTDGAKSIDNSVFFGRLGQRVIHFLTSRTSAGTLYEVDSRLRPSGSAGLLVSSLDAFEQYQMEDAWTWEHQALIRARVVTGDNILLERFRQIRRKVLLKSRDPEHLKEEVRDMRERMRLELATRQPQAFDLKQDRGGIADIEFVVQYGTLRWASHLGSFLDFTDNIRLLDGFASVGLLSAEDCRVLADAYRAYRARAHTLALLELPAVVANNEFIEYREGVARIWSDLLGD